MLAFSNLFGVATGDEPASVLHGIVAAKTRLEARRGVFETPYKGPVYIVDAMTNNPARPEARYRATRGDCWACSARSSQRPLEHLAQLRDTGRSDDRDDRRDPLGQVDPQTDRRTEPEAAKAARRSICSVWCSCPTCSSERPRLSTRCVRLAGRGERVTARRPGAVRQRPAGRNRAKRWRTNCRSSTASTRVKVTVIRGQELVDVKLPAPASNEGAMKIHALTEHNSLRMPIATGISSLPLMVATAFRFCAAARADQESAAIEQRAIPGGRGERIAPSIVKIETVGGLERIGNMLVNTGPTTGLIVSPDGFIISSAFNFISRPSSILVGLPDGTRTPARLVATDRQRMLVLLKIDVDEKLPVPEAVPESEIRVGQWAIALGRTFDAAQPNLSVGIVSGLNRIWGTAMQTDAKISPNNYGGPLVDIRGRVLGVLAPLSPDKHEEFAGVEWYDSGIGFAVPLAHINTVLPQLSAGHDLKPGILGVSLDSRDIYTQAGR